MWCMLCLCENVAFVGPVMSPKSNGIVTQLVRFGNDAASLFLTYTDRQEFTQRQAHTLSSSLQNKHPFAPLHMHALSPSLIVPVHLSLLYFFPLSTSLDTIFQSTMCSYPSLHLFPSQSSPAMGLCPFIIHGVVLMAQAAMSDVNLCASKTHSAYTASARRVTVRATGLRYHTALNQHAQSHLGHTAHANPLLFFKPPQTIPPFSESQFGMLL